MGITILLSIGFFLAIILLLVGLLLFVKAKLSPSGALTITINNEKKIEVEGGTTLLNALNSQVYSFLLLAVEVVLVYNVYVKFTVEV